MTRDRKSVNIELLRQAIRNVAEHARYDLGYSAEVARLAKDASAEYGRLVERAS